MSWEILEAICEYYKGDDKDSKELIKDCLMYLKKINHNKDKKLDGQIDDILTDMFYCCNCGNKLETYTWEEYHSDIDYWESFSKTYCPYCDIERK